MFVVVIAVAVVINTAMAVVVDVVVLVAVTVMFRVRVGDVGWLVFRGGANQLDLAIFIHSGRPVRG